jgi:hypothetical protein
MSFLEAFDVATHGAVALDRINLGRRHAEVRGGDPLDSDWEPGPIVFAGDVAIIESNLLRNRYSELNVNSIELPPFTRVQVLCGIRASKTYGKARID